MAPVLFLQVVKQLHLQRGRQFLRCFWLNARVPPNSRRASLLCPSSRAPGDLHHLLLPLKPSRPTATRPPPGDLLPPRGGGVSNLGTSEGTELLEFSFTLFVRLLRKEKGWFEMV